MQGNEKTTRRRAGARQRLKVVLFSGGRGSRVLSRELVSNPRVDLVIAVNGYDDGKSTGAVRRFDWDIKVHRPTVATIMLGMNDVGRSLYAPGKSGADTCDGDLRKL